MTESGKYFKIYKVFWWDSVIFHHVTSHTHASFTTIQDKLFFSNMINDFVIIRGMNSMFRDLVRDFPARIRSAHLSESVSTADLSYLVLYDDNIASNNNA